MPIVVIPRLKAKPGRAPELERVLRHVSAETRKEEPGPIIYQVLRCRTDPHSFAIVEIFPDQEALDRHAKSPHLQENLAVIESLLAEPWTAEYFEAIG